MKAKKILIGIMFLALFIMPIMPVTASNSPTAATVVEEDTSLSDIIEADKIVVAMDAAYPPFENLVNESVVGFDVDIMEYVADKLNVTLEIKNVAWDTIFTGLTTGTYDCICSAVTITDTRKETMDFTRWYYKSTQAVMVSLKNPKNITCVEDVNATDVTVGFQLGTTSQWYCEDEGIVATQKSYNTVTLAIQTLKQGGIDVVLGDYATLYSGKLSNPDSFAIIDTFSPEDFGIVFPKNSTAAVTAINGYINELLGSDVANPVFSATYNASHVEWMNGALPTVDFVLDAVPAPQVSIPGFSIIGIIAIIPIVSAIYLGKMKKRT